MPYLFSVLPFPFPDPPALPRAGGALAATGGVAVAEDPARRHGSPAAAVGILLGKGGAGLLGDCGLRERRRRAGLLGERPAAEAAVPGRLPLAPCAGKLDSCSHGGSTVPGDDGELREQRHPRRREFFFFFFY
ncbi:unnamed protein product [Urochloa humidicola]